MFKIVPYALPIRDLDNQIETTYPNDRNVPPSPIGAQREWYYGAFVSVCSARIYGRLTYFS